MKYFLATVTKSFTSLFQWGKGLFFGGKNGRTFDFFGSSCNKCRFQRFVGYAARLLQSRSLVLVCAVWISLSPLVLKAELSQDDRNFLANNLNPIYSELNSIELHTDSMNSRLLTISNKLGDFYSNNSQWNSTIVKTLQEIINQGDNFGYTVENTFKADYDAKNATLIAKLESIITALEDLKASDDSGSSGDGSGTTINETWLTEDTFKSDFGGFVDKYDTFLSSWGFQGGSGDSLKSWLNKNRNLEGVVWFQTVDLSSTNVPFPGNDSYWPSVYDGRTFISTLDPFQDIVRALYGSSFETASLNVRLAKKQGWNDWQAHTNLISRLDHIFQLEDKSELSFNSETGQVTLKDTGGSGGEVTDVRPVSTNSVDTAVQAVTNSTELIAGIFNREEVEKRYLNDELLTVGQNYGGIGDEIGSVAAGVMVTPWFTIDFNVWGQSYRNVLPIDRLNSWRTVAGYLWNLASIVLCVVLVRRWGNM